MTSAGTAALGVGVVCGVAAAVLLAAGGGGAADRPAVPPGALYVDGASVGGQCRDERSAEEATSAARPWCTLARAARATPAGRVAVVRRGTYTNVDLEGVRHPGWVTLRAYPGEAVGLTGGVTIRSSTRLRLQGFRIWSRADPAVTIVASDRVALVRNNIAGQGVVVRNARRVTIAGNRIHDLLRPPGPESLAGYGIWANGYERGAAGEQLADLVIRGNQFLGIPQDGIQLGGGPSLVQRVVIEANRFDRIVRAVPDDHPDAIQVLGGRDIVIRRNRVIRAEECLLVKDDLTTGLVLERNRMIGSPSMGHCVQVYDAPGARIIGNTFWQKAAGWPQALIIGSDGLRAPTRTVVRHNIINRYQLQNRSWVIQDYNVIVTGPRLGPHDTAKLPRGTAAP